MERRTILLAALAVAGIILSGYLLYLHYNGDGSSFCDVNDRLNCDVVNSSPYALFLGVPVALFGILYYLGLLKLALFEKLVRRTLRMDADVFSLLFLAYAALGLLFSVYLTAIEAFILGVFCMLCLASAGIVVAVNAIAFMRWRAA